MKITAVAILEVMWGPVAKAVGPRFFAINPRNHSGRKLHGWLAKDHPDFVATNACPEVVSNARGRGTPSKEWLSGNLRKLQEYGRLQVVLVCGKVARDTYNKADLPGVVVIEIDHPAARTWTKDGIEFVRRIIAESKVSVRVTKQPSGMYTAEQI